MAKLKLKILKKKHLNLNTRQMGYIARVKTNGKVDFNDIAEDASKNTTLHRAELKMSFEICLDTVAKMLKQGYIVDLGPVGKLYPSCSSQWVEQEDDLLLENVRPSLYFHPSNEVASAIRSAKLTWEKGDSQSPN